jgi:hypothetical protein
MIGSAAQLSEVEHRALPAGMGDDGGLKPSLLGVWLTDAARWIKPAA